MPAHCKPTNTDPVFAIIDKADAAYLTFLRELDNRAKCTRASNAFVHAQGAIHEAAPKTLDGFLAKWTAFLYFETSLEVDGIDYLATMGRMIDEVAALVEVQQRLCNGAAVAAE